MRSATAGTEKKRYTTQGAEHLIALTMKISSGSGVLAGAFENRTYDRLAT